MMNNLKTVKQNKVMKDKKKYEKDFEDNAHKCNTSSKQDEKVGDCMNLNTKHIGCVDTHTHDNEASI